MKKNKFILQRSSKADNRLVCTHSREVLARMIKTEREKKGWSIYQLSKESGVQINHISRIEQGLFSARYDTIEKLLQAMGKSLAVV